MTRSSRRCRLLDTTKEEHHDLVDRSAGNGRLTGDDLQGGETRLQSKATVTCEVARLSALERVKDNKHATIRSAELEEESGRLVYSFDISRRGHAGVEEVQVDAKSGSVVSVKHESASAEAKEKD